MLAAFLRDVLQAPRHNTQISLRDIEPLAQLQNPFVRTGHKDESETIRNKTVTVDRGVAPLSSQPRLVDARQVEFGQGMVDDACLDGEQVRVKGQVPRTVCKVEGADAMASTAVDIKRLVKSFCGKTTLHNILVHRCLPDPCPSSTGSPQSAACPERCSSEGFRAYYK